ncbi:hypothetical protein Poli38472_011899 [Pythium oligandrum]|uniref:Bacterial Pleckstrin homology domain-containing protein n=1 Tax=Pythium oligandrum TaxID=41045 RepID=A0A8K1C7X3_PYTOL|nr:hypothetical protein Poli38472_011899 [Pythium oligandrum]|eukprot:TMW58311.1 hypothetical protein Poli38472_011899 [Pythium oligandrum]
MFKGLTKDLTGTADICNTVTDFRKLDVNSFLLPGEQVMFAFQSAKEEWVFTNEALISVYGENATTTRKLVERFEFRDLILSRIKFETTGRADRDCEIKFHIGSSECSIDIARKEEQIVKKYYKALIALSREQERRRRRLAFATRGVDHSADALYLQGLNFNAQSSADPLSAQAGKMLDWLQTDFDTVNPRCYREVIAQALR